MKILVSGANGFIGKVIARRMERAGHQVAKVSLRLWRTMLLDMGRGYDVVIHCGWEGVQARHRHDETLQQENVECFRWLLAHCAATPPELFISFGSQAEIYAPTEAYSQAKLACRQLLHEYGLTKHRRWLWLQLFSVYGQGESKPWLIPSLIEKMLRHEPIETTPGEQLMDYLHVIDVARAVELGIHSGACGIYELGTGLPIKLRDLVTKMKELTRSRSELRFGAIPYRPGQIMRACANPNEFNDATGWSPTIELNQGLSRVVEHLRED